MPLDKLIHKYEIEVIELEALYNKDYVKNILISHHLKIVIEDLKQLKLAFRDLKIVFFLFTKMKGKWKKIVK